MNEQREKEVNLQFCNEGNISNNLNVLLEQSHKEELERMYFYLTKKNIRTNKKQLIKKVYKLLTNKDTIYKIILNLLNNEYEQLIKIIDNSGIIQDDYVKVGCLELLKNFGIVYIINQDNQIYVVVPDEIINIIKSINLEECRNQIQKNTRLVDLVYAMINLYGAIRFDEYIDCCLDYFHYESPEEINILSVFNGGRMNPPTLFDVDGITYVTKEEFLDYDFYSLIESKIYHADLYEIRRKDIDLADLLKYSDFYYFEPSDETEKLKKYLVRHGLDESSSNLLIATIIQTIRIDYTTSVIYISDIFDDFEFVIDDNNMDEILGLINSIWNSIPVWGTCGWTNKEILLSTYLRDGEY